MRKGQCWSLSRFRRGLETEREPEDPTPSPQAPSDSERACPCPCPAFHHLRGTSSHLQGPQQLGPQHPLPTCPHVPALCFLITLSGQGPRGQYYYSHFLEGKLSPRGLMMCLTSHREPGDKPLFSASEGWFPSFSKWTRTLTRQAPPGGSDSAGRETQERLTAAASPRPTPGRGVSHAPPHKELLSSPARVL